MKVQVTRRDGQSIIGRKKSLSFTISNDLEELGKASRTNFCVDSFADQWSVSYQTDEMEDAEESIEFIFKIEDLERTLQPSHMIYWKNDLIEDSVRFDVKY